ncbi:origin recognition complex subunit 1 [Aplochiton taeniatus]
MVRYFTRLRLKRIYKWGGRPKSYDRKIEFFEYESLIINLEGLPRITVISTGQYILIEGEDDDNPYVAKVIKLFGDKNQEQMKATVQWFMRVSEVPPNKMKLLGRHPHPQEIFYYLGHTCDNEIDAESILSTVQVKHLSGPEPFPEAANRQDTLYVKLSWDTKAFKVLDAALMGDTLGPFSPSPCPKPSLPPSPPCSPLAMSVSRGPAHRALPTPDPMVMWRAGSAAHSRGCVSADKMANSEAESIHSTSKLSAAKSLSAKRRGNVAGTPGVRKKLELFSLKLGPRVADRVDGVSFRPTSVSLERLFPIALGEEDSTRELLGLSPLEDEVFEAGPLTSSTKTPSKRPATPRRNYTLGPKPEVENENSPLQAVMTPRSSKRKSALLVSSRIRTQLNLLENCIELDSDGDDSDDCFVPSKRDLQSSEEDEQADSDDDTVAKKSKSAAGCQTPRSHHKTRNSARTPSKKATPSTPRTPRHATPSIPSRTLPARQPGSVLEEARARLHVSSVPESLPCREQEFQDIYNFVESKVMDGTGGCMYISGVPGTGKTATVHEVIRCLQHASDADDIPAFRFVEINGMKMTEPHQAYVQILQKLTNQKATADHAASLLEKRFSKPAPKKETTVLLVDELDLLWTRKQNVMYNLFDWPTRRHARLVVLTIANTMDLPERIMINRVASRLGLTRMSFQPYSFRQLQQIITSRLNKVKAFEEDALQLVSRKVAALSGDARRCLDICRRATEICEHSAANPSASGLVGMSHVMEALDEMFSSAYITAIRCSSVQEQLFLRAVLAEFRRLGLEEATFQQVFVQHQALCRVEGLQPISVSEGLAVCQRLGACRLLLLEASRLDVLQRVRLNVSQDDVLYALKAD